MAALTVGHDLLALLLKLALGTLAFVWYPVDGARRQCARGRHDAHVSHPQRRGAAIGHRQGGERDGDRHRAADVLQRLSTGDLHRAAAVARRPAVARDRALPSALAALVSVLEAPAIWAHRTGLAAVTTFLILSAPAPRSCPCAPPSLRPQLPRRDAVQFLLERGLRIALFFVSPLIVSSVAYVWRDAHSLVGA